MLRVLIVACMLVTACGGSGQNNSNQQGTSVLQATPSTGGLSERHDRKDTQQ